MSTITDIAGVFAGATCCGIKEGRNDLSFIYVPAGTASAATFTRNRFRAPCVEYSENAFNRGTVKAVIINAGNANAATGRQGFQNAEATAKAAGAALGLKAEEVAVASTGIIGVQLPMDKITTGLKTLLIEPKRRDGAVVAKAILTTDLREKSVFLEKTISGRKVVIAGIAKGSGMIAPNMATMLAFLVTNAKLPGDVLKKELRDAVDLSFNMSTVDSDTSTNDMVMLFASGEESVPLETAKEQAEFSALLTEACTALAKLVVLDGEGAEKLIEVCVRGAASRGDARRIALNIANSPLVKTAIHGADPNWGRVMMAAGKDPDAQVEQDKVDLYFNSYQVLSRGMMLPFERDALREELKKPEITVTVALNLGSFEATAWGCDLSKGYIDINTQYS